MFVNRSENGARAILPATGEWYLLVIFSSLRNRNS